MRFFFFILIAPNIILAQGISEYQKNSIEVEYSEVINDRSSIKEEKNKWQISTGTGKYLQKQYSSLQVNKKLGNIIHLGIKKPIFKNFYVSYSLMRLATESLNGIGENYFEDLVSFNSLSLECNLFGPGHLFDIGAMGSLGLSMGKYYNIDQMIDFIQIQSSFRVFGILRVHLLNSSFKALDICIGPQVILDQTNQISRNIIIVGLNSSINI